MVAHQEASKHDPLAWWAHSQSHGWVVLDKNLPKNRNSFDPESYTFIRCRDWSEYEQAEQPWNYKEAGRYLDTLTPAEAIEARRELAGFKQKFAEQF